MRFLVFIRNFSGYFRQFEPAFREMLERGHEIHLSLERRDDMRGQEWAQTLIRAHPGRVSWDSGAIHPAADPWFQAKRDLRRTRDYVQFLRPDYNRTPEFRARAERRAPGSVSRVMRFPPLRTSPVLKLLSSGLNTLEDATPVSPGAVGYIEEIDPHAVLVVPHLMPGALHTEYVRAAMSLGLPAAVCIASWDNLSSKQLLRVRPDLVTVWNEIQKREAVQIHGIPADSVEMTGAQVYDPWFEWEASPREEFCAKVGLPPGRPFLLYTAGALFPAEITEAQFGVRWLEALRSSEDERLREVAVLIRPHPKRVEEWGEVDLTRFENVAFWPREGRMPVSSEDRADFFDSIHHSAGVVGVNTSAMIEAGIVGRRVHTVLVPEFSGSQFGTTHFAYLRDAGGGLLRIAGDMPEHLGHLSELLEDSPDSQFDNSEFVRTFVRPQGLDRPAADGFVDAVERMVFSPRVPPVDPPLRSRIARRPLARWARRRQRAAEERMTGRKLVTAEERETRVERNAERARRQREGQLNKGTKVAGARASAQASRRKKEDAVDAVRRKLRTFAGSDTPVLAGPWTGNAALELLVWRSFLVFAIERRPGLAERLTLISHGSPPSWYEPLGLRYLDVSPDADDPVAEAAEALGLDEFDRLEATLAHDAFERLGRRGKLVNADAKKLIFAARPIDRVDAGEGVDLPERYVAVDLTPAGLELTDELLAPLAAAPALVVLDSGGVDLGGVVEQERILDLSPGLNGAAESRALRTAVAGAAGAVYAALGSELGYLGPLCGVPTALLHAGGDQEPPEATLAVRLFATPEFGPLHAIDVTAGPRAAKQVEAALAAVAETADVG